MVHLITYILERWKYSAQFLNSVFIQHPKCCSTTRPSQSWNMKPPISFTVRCLLCELFSMLDDGGSRTRSCSVVDLFALLIQLFFSFDQWNYLSSLQFSFFSFSLLLSLSYRIWLSLCFVRYVLFMLFFYFAITSTRCGCWNREERHAEARDRNSIYFTSHPVFSCFLFSRFSRCNSKLNQTRWPDSTCCSHHQPSSLNLHLKLSHSSWLHFSEFIILNNNYLPH